MNRKHYLPVTCAALAISLGLNIYQISHKQSKISDALATVAYATLDSTLLDGSSDSIPEFCDARNIEQFNQDSGNPEYSKKVSDACKYVELNIYKYLTKK